MITLDAPPKLILPDHYQASRPAIIRPVGDLARYFPVELDRKQRRAIVAELVKRGAVDDRAEASKLIEAAIPFGMFATAPIPVTLTYVDNSTSLAATITVPAGAANNDIAVLFDASTTTGSPTVPSGFTLLSDTTSSIRTILSWGVLSGSPGGTTLTGLAASAAKSLIIFRPNRPINNGYASTFNTQATTGDPASQTVTGTGLDPAVLYLAALSRTGTTPHTFTTVSPAMTQFSTGSTSRSIRSAYRIENTTPNNQTVDCGTGSGGTTIAMHSGLIRFD